MRAVLISSLAVFAIAFSLRAAPQASGMAGTVTGTVADPSAASIAGAKVSLDNALSGYHVVVQTDATGAFRFVNVPPNTYMLQVAAAGFAPTSQSLIVRSSVPVNAPVVLQVAAENQSVEVSATATQVETDPSAHTDVDRSEMDKLPTMSPGSGLSDAITYSSGAVAADANGSFHPSGDHAQVSYVIDGQVISDQQSKTFSTQLPTNALQSMELITGSPEAEFGDKSTMVVNAVTRSGLGATKAFGNIESTWSSFATYGADASLGFGTEKFGEFLAVDGLRSGRFLDTPEFLPIHDIGNNERIFDRLDYQPSGQDSLHLDLFTARNWFQVPNDYDQLAQDQRQRVLTYNIAPGYQHTFNATTLLTVNPFVRRDQVDYYGSRNPFDDTPVFATQNRFLTNYGIKADVSHVFKKQEVKVGLEIQQTRLEERFTLGVTDPLYNAICVNSSGDALDLPSVTSTSECAAAGAGDSPNPNLQPGLIPYDLTRGGNYFNFSGKSHINQYGFYIQDKITLGGWTINAGLRDDQYNGLSEANGIQPRLGISYEFKPTSTVLRAAFSRTFETPFNENLILSSGTGAGGLAENVFGAAASDPLKPGNRNQFNTGLQQKLGRYIIIDADYVWKYTHNAYDFDVLFNTPITFPISWHNSKIDGVDARISSADFHGFQAYTTMGHTRARYFPPEVGGLIPQSGLPTGAFRIDHDQQFQQTTSIRYQRPNHGEYFSFIWRFDSGLVASAVPDVATALTLDGDQQAAMGFYCGSVFATVANPITSCPSGGGATQLHIPAAGTYNEDTNPSRIAPRNLFDLAVGTDNLLHATEKQRMTVELSVVNMTDKVALYNFLSTFSGTHFVQPRTYEAHVGYVF
jgi:hypothetical protein